MSRLTVPRWMSRATYLFLLLFMAMLVFSGCSPLGAAWRAWRSINPGRQPDPVFPVKYESRSLSAAPHLLVIDGDGSYRVYRESELVQVGRWSYEPKFSTWCLGVSKCLIADDNWMVDKDAVLVPGVGRWRESPQTLLWPPEPKPRE